MNRITFAKPVLAAAVAIGTLAAASAAHARSDVFVSIGVQAPFGYVHAMPAPVVVQPAPVIVQPRPVYVQPAPVYVQPRPVYYGRDDHYGHHGRRVHHHRGWGDADRDGVPNRYDRAPHNPYRR